MKNQLVRLDVSDSVADSLRIIPEQVPGAIPYKMLKMATSDAATVLGWSGEMNPYKEGSLGTISTGNYADIILVDGNPLESLDVIQRDNVAFVMK